MTYDKLIYATSYLVSLEKREISCLFNINVTTNVKNWVIGIFSGYYG